MIRSDLSEDSVNRDLSGPELGLDDVWRSWTVGKKQYDASPGSGRIQGYMSG
jgi:hypothetical protein